MRIDKLSRYEQDVKKLIKKRKLTKEEIEDTENLFLKDKKSKSLRYHPISCKKDKQRYSISLSNSPYRILFSEYIDVSIFRRLVSHGEYDRINKDC